MYPFQYFVLVGKNHTFQPSLKVQSMFIACLYRTKYKNKGILEGLNGVNRQPSNGPKINRQPSKTEYFYHQPKMSEQKLAVKFLRYP